MVDGAVEIAFFDSWAWLIFIAAGLVMIILELKKNLKLKEVLSMIRS